MEEKNIIVEDKLVSIIVPCYNHEIFIDDCVKGILSQTYKPIEVLFLDDCSQDRSYEKLLLWEEKLKIKCHRVIIEKNKANKGIVKNLNIMINKAKGKYIKIIASDDILLPYAIEKLVLEHQKTGADVIYSNAYKFPQNDYYENIFNSSYELYYKKLPLQGVIPIEKLLEYNFICAPSVLFPRSTYQKYGMYDENFNFEDFEYWLRLSNKARFSYVDTPTVCYRTMSQSFSRFDNDLDFTRSRNYYNQKKLIFNKYKEQLDLNKISIYLNSELGWAIDVGDNILVKEIEKEIIDINCRISKKNIIKKNKIVRFVLSKYKNYKKKRHIK